MGKKHYIDVEQAIRAIRKVDSRYPAEAYLFVREALDFTLARARKRGHIRGQELLEGIRCFAIDQFGPLALSVFGNWDVNRTEDFGEIVFNMVEHGILGKTEEDSREDFADGFDFGETFGRTPPLDEDFKL